MHRFETCAFFLIPTNRNMLTRHKSFFRLGAYYLDGGKV